MKNECSKNYDGNDVLVLNYDGSMSADVEVDEFLITVYEHGHDGYENNMIGIKLEDWEEFKAFVDSQISKGDSDEQDDTKAH